MKIIKNNFIALLIFILFNFFGYWSFAVMLEEKKLMEQARSAYEVGNLDKALELYNKIPQSSDFWIEALEEKSWTQLRKNNVSESLATTTTLLSDLLSPQVGPEPYLLKTIINYKLCNIKGVLEDFELFKNRFKQRSDEIEKLAMTKQNSSSEKAISILKKHKSSLGELKADNFGVEIQYLPRYFYRDKELLSSVSTENDSLILTRLSQLAKEEVNEIESILQKMHLLESQIVQHVFAYNEELQKKRKSEFSSKTNKNTLFFPFSKNNDIWLDELDVLQAATNDCPADPFKGEKK